MKLFISEESDQHSGYIRNVRFKPKPRYWLSVPIFSSSVHGTLQSPYKLSAQLPNIVTSCSRHGVIAAWLPAERPGWVIPLSETFTLLGVHLQLHPCADVCEMDTKLWCVRKASPLTTLQVYPGADTLYILPTCYDPHLVSFTGDIQPLQFTQQAIYSGLLLFLIVRSNSCRCLLCISPNKSLLEHSNPSQTGVYFTHTVHFFLSTLTPLPPLQMKGFHAFPATKLPIFMQMISHPLQRFSESTGNFGPQTCFGFKVGLRMKQFRTVLGR